MKFQKRTIDVSNPGEACAYFDIDNDGVMDIVCGAGLYGKA